MNRNRGLLLTGISMLLAAGTAGAFISGGFDLLWSTVDGGGSSSGGDFELSGTIGQPDAGLMAGGEFKLTGGFWGGVQSGGGGGCTHDPAWICDGDGDGDGQINPVDSGIVQSLFGTCEAPRSAK